jgi:hypothetical protein
MRLPRLVFIVLCSSLVASALATTHAQKTTPAPTQIGILPFLDASGAMSSDTAAAVGRLVQAEMSHSAPNLTGKMLTLPSGTSLTDLDGEKAVAIAKGAGVDVVLLGTVLDAKSEESSKGGYLPSIAGQTVGMSVRSVKANVTLQADLYRTATGERITSLRVPGSHSDSHFGGSVYTNLGSWDGNASTFLDSPLGKALEQAVAGVVKKISTTKLD